MGCFFSALCLQGMTFRLTINTIFSCHLQDKKRIRVYFFQENYVQLYHQKKCLSTSRKAGGVRSSLFTWGPGGRAGGEYFRLTSTDAQCYFYKYVACPDDGNRSCSHIGAVAQLGERKTGSLEVRGSIPLSSTRIFRGVMTMVITPCFLRGPLFLADEAGNGDGGKG